MSEALDLIAEHLARPASGWSIGTYGVLAEFARTADEPCDAVPLQVVTARGALRVESRHAVAALAYEVLSLRPRQSHSANIRLPADAVPGLTLYPPHPAKDEAGVRKRFSHGEHAAFQSVFGRFADPEARAAKAAVVAALERGDPPAHGPATRIGRQAARIALRQLRLAGAAGPALAAWERALEPPAVRAA
jgi:hypothetical protein